MNWELGNNNCETCCDGRPGEFDGATQSERNPNQTYCTPSDPVNKCNATKTMENLQAIVLRNSYCIARSLFFVVAVWIRHGAHVEKQQPTDHIFTTHNKKSTTRNDGIGKSTLSLERSSMCSCCYIVVHDSLLVCRCLGWLQRSPRHHM